MLVSPIIFMLFAVSIRIYKYLDPYLYILFTLPFLIGSLSINDVQLSSVLPPLVRFSYSLISTSFLDYKED